MIRLSEVLIEGNLETIGFFQMSFKVLQGFPFEPLPVDFLVSDAELVENHHMNHFQGAVESSP